MAGGARQNFDLSGGYTPEELERIIRHRRELEDDGYVVERIAISTGGRPAARVFARGERDPVEEALTAVKALLRAARRLRRRKRVEVPPEDLLALERARAALTALSRVFLPREPETVSEVTDVDLSKLTKGENDAKD
jgi:hypothetical protein